MPIKFARLDLWLEKKKFLWNRATLCFVFLKEANKLIVIWQGMSTSYNQDILDQWPLLNNTNQICIIINSIRSKKFYFNHPVEHLARAFFLFLCELQGI